MISWTACPHWWMGTKWLLNLFQLLFFLQAPELWPIVSLRQHATVLSTHWPQGKHSLMCYPTKSPFHSASPHRFFPALSLASVLSCFSHVLLCTTLWTVACQAPLSMGFSRQEYWSGLPCLPSEDLPNPGIKSTSLVSPALAGGFFTISATWEAHVPLYWVQVGWTFSGREGIWKMIVFCFSVFSSRK